MSRARKLPLFIPRPQVIPGVRYTDYVAHPKGLFHKSVAMTKGTVSKGNLAFRQPGLAHTDWGVQPTRKRTPQERLDSLSKRIIDQYQRLGWSESLLDDLVALTWRAGEPMGREQVRELARHKLGPNKKPLSNDILRAYAGAKLQEAEKTQEQEDRKSVVRKSPYVLDPQKPERELAER